MMENSVNGNAGIKLDMKAALSNGSFPDIARHRKEELLKLVWQF